MDVVDFLKTCERFLVLFVCHFVDLTTRMTGFSCLTENSYIWGWDCFHSLDENVRFKDKCASDSKVFSM